MAKTMLAMGLNRYGSGSDLYNCVNDCNLWSKVAQSEGFTSTQLKDKEATRARILQATGELIAAAKPGDSLIWQYSGHGSYVDDQDSDEPDGQDEVICPIDIFTNGPITDDELYTLFANRPLGIKLFIVADSCFSGSVSRFAPSRETKRPRVRFMPPQTFLSPREASRMPRGFRSSRVLPKSRHAGLLLSGCSDTEYSYDGYENEANGAMTAVALLRAYKKLKANSSYTVWHKEIRKLLPTADTPQTPQLFGSSTMKRQRRFS